MDCAQNANNSIRIIGYGGVTLGYNFSAGLPRQGNNLSQMTLNDGGISMNSTVSVNGAMVCNSVSATTLTASDNTSLQGLTATTITASSNTSLQALTTTNLTTTGTITNGKSMFSLTNSNVQNLNGGGNNLVLDTTVFNINSTISNDGNGTYFRCNFAGYYSFSGGCNIGTNAANCFVSLSKNGNEVQRGTQLQQNSVFTIFATVNGIMFLAVNDTVYIYVYTRNTASTVGSVGAASYFQGYYIRSG